MKKRIFSFLLAVLMLAALLPTAAFADESTRKAVPVTGGNIYVDMEKGEVVDCDDTVTEMIVPEQVDGVTIQAISDRAFQERKNLKRVRAHCSLLDPTHFINVPDSKRSRLVTVFRRLKTMLFPTAATWSAYVCRKI